MHFFMKRRSENGLRVPKNGFQRLGRKLEEAFVTRRMHYQSCNESIFATTGLVHSSLQQACLLHRSHIRHHIEVFQTLTGLVPNEIEASKLRALLLQVVAWTQGISEQPFKMLYHWVLAHGSQNYDDTYSWHGARV